MRLGRPRTIRFTGVAVSVLTASLAACGSSGGGGGTSGNPSNTGEIKIGLNAELSGPLQNPVTSSQAAAVKLAIEDINGAGGVKVAGTTYKFVLDSKDNLGQVPEAVSVAKALVQDGVIAALPPSFLPFDSHYRVFKDAHKITFGAAPPITLPLLIEGAAKNPELFGTIQTAPPIIAGWAKQIITLHPNVKKVAILNQNDETGIAMRDVLKGAAPQLGLEVVAAELVPPETTDFAPALTKIKDAHPDLIYLGVQAQIVGAVRTAIDLNAVPMIWSFGMPPTAVGTLQRQFNANTLLITDFRLPFTAQFAPSDKRALIDRFDKAGITNVGIALATYDFMQLLVQAIQAAGTATDPVAIAKALPGTKYNSAFGETVMAADHTASGPQGILEVKATGVTIHQYANVTTPTETKAYDFPLPK
jgi:branched-chain amino acid transport system substrate-binding protein